MSDDSKFISWDDKYLVNIPELDDAHFELFRLVNEFHKLTHVPNNDDKKILRAFHGFLEYAYSHFSEEENYMKKINYAGFDQHKLSHENIKNQFEEYFSNYKNGTLDLNVFLNFVKEWLTGHIMQEDQKYIA